MTYEDHCLCKGKKVLKFRDGVNFYHTTRIINFQLDHDTKLVLYLYEL